MYIMRIVSLLCISFVVSGASHLPRHGRDKRAIKSPYQEKSEKNSPTKKKILNRQPSLRLVEKPPTILTAAMFDSHVLSCRVGSSPPATIHWLKNGKPLHQSSWESNSVDEVSDEGISSSGILGISFTMSKLYVSCLTPQDEGDYTCVAETPYNRMSATTTLIVNGLNKHPNTYCIASKASLEEAVPAWIHMWTDSRLEIKGNDVQLFCRAVGSPAPQVIWYGPRGERIHNGHKYRMLENGDLIVKDISWEENMGIYTCLAENSYASDNVTAFLYPTAWE